MRGGVADIHVPDDRNVRDRHAYGIVIGHVGFLILKQGASDEDGLCGLRRDPTGVAHLKECAVQNGGGEGKVVEIPDQAVFVIAMDKV